MLRSWGANHAQSVSVLLATACLLPSMALAESGRIDRKALVDRHAITLTSIDPHAPVMLGNGSLGFTADITGLQSFPGAYSALVPLSTMAQWAWHSFPNPAGFSERDGLVSVPVPGRGDQLYPWIRAWSELESRPALKWLRENPHRIALGRVGLMLRHSDGRSAVVTDLRSPTQRLDLWRGTLVSRFMFDGQPVTVTTRVLPDRDVVLADISSPLVALGRVGVDIRYPGVSPKLNPDPADWVSDVGHDTTVRTARPDHVSLLRQIDDTRFGSHIRASGGLVSQQSAHHFRVIGRGSDQLSVAVSFDSSLSDEAPQMTGGASKVARHWQQYWTSGAAIDLSASTDKRAHELERRLVLSQYLAAINQAGRIPPQEEGLFSNSWNGKFHLEVMPLHLAHFAAWGRRQPLEANLGWYVGQLDAARRVARRHGMPGAWWTKMSGPEGRNSPSTINPFIMWQQPAPIYLAEMARRAGDPLAFQRYGAMVEETAAFLAAWPVEGPSGQLHLGPPIIPVQENHPPLTTRDPGFEIAFFRWGIETAQQWRTLSGKPRRDDWDAFVARLVAPPVVNGLLVPAATTPDFWVTTMGRCSRKASGHDCLNRDHPSFLLSYGLIQDPDVSAKVAADSLDAVRAHWDLRQTWGWDFPVLAMTALRLGRTEEAIDWLFADYANNRWGVTGMTPRVHLDEHAADLFAQTPGLEVGPDGPGYRRAAETYFPSNGSLLLVAALMANAERQKPGSGFPLHWRARVEGFVPVP